MLHPDALRVHLADAMAGASSPLDAANRLCHACVVLLDVDGASVSFLHQGTTRGTFGSSSSTSRRLDEFQFTFGEGPCLDAARYGGPVFAADLAHPAELRWPAFREAVLGAGVSAVFALPVAVASANVGALDLYNMQTGSMADRAFSGALCAAELAARPLLDLMTAHVDWDSISQGDDDWEQLASLERVEVYQATGMVMASLDATAAEALARLRGHAFAYGLTASEVAWAIVERRLVLASDDVTGELQ